MLNSIKMEENNEKQIYSRAGRKPQMADQSDLSWSHYANHPPDYCRWLCLSRLWQVQTIGNAIATFASIDISISTGICFKYMCFYGQICTVLYHKHISSSDFRDSSVCIARGKAYIAGNKEKGKTKISCKNCCPRLGRLLACLVAWLAQWKKSALFARDSSPRATPHHPKQPTPYCLAYKSPDTHYGEE